MTKAEYEAARDAAIRHRPDPKPTSPPAADKRTASEMTQEEWTAAHPPVVKPKLATDMTPEEYRAARAAAIKR